MSTRKKTTRVTASAQPVSKVDPRYLSVALDIGQIAEPTRFWNPDGSGECSCRPSFDFSSTRLSNLSAALAPAYLRIGGTEADRCFYALDCTNPLDTPPPPPPPHSSVLTAAHLDSLGAFANRCGFDLAFCVNAGRGARVDEGGAWESAQARSLMRYVTAHAIPVRVYEFGNEPNAWPLFHHNLTVQPEAYARDLATLIALRDECAADARIAAPATAYWPTLGEVPALGWVAGAWRPTLIRDYLGRVLRAATRAPDIVSWHYYPGLSDRSNLAMHRNKAKAAGLAAGACAVAALVAATASPPEGVWARAAYGLSLAACTAISAVGALWCFAVRPVSDPTSLRHVHVLDTVIRWAEVVRASIRSASDPHTPERTPAVWLGETGSAQVGGQPGVSGTWAATLWWLDQLGSLALLDTQVQVRQTLCGADYGLLDEATLSPTPEFWASVLWKRTMGDRVYRLEATPPPPPTLRLYCHSAPDGRGRTVLAINLDAVAAEVEIDGAGAAAEAWVLDAPHLTARNVTVNGVEPCVATDGTVPTLSGMPLRARWRHDTVVVPPGAAVFVSVS